jgi:aspartyl-tRNA synthetase
MDFPLFKYNEEEKRWDSEHHPFTSPDTADWAKHLPTGELEKIRSRAYDLVLNGNEIASGSIRINKRDLQKEIFKTIGLDEKEASERFGFLLKAFEFGPPPHGGIALGIDRVITILLGLESIREVIAFPKNQKAVDPMTDAPSPVAERQLKELGVKLR